MAAFQAGPSMAATVVGAPQDAPRSWDLATATLPRLVAGSYVDATWWSVPSAPRETGMSMASTISPSGCRNADVFDCRGRASGSLQPASDRRLVTMAAVVGSSPTSATASSSPSSKARRSSAPLAGMTVSGSVHEAPPSTVVAMYTRPSSRWDSVPWGWLGFRCTCQATCAIPGRTGSVATTVVCWYSPRGDTTAGSDQLRPKSVEVDTVTALFIQNSVPSTSGCPSGVKSPWTDTR